MFILLRFDPGFRIAIEDIALSNTANAATYRGWTIARIWRESGAGSGVGDGGGKKKKTPFNFSGRLATLPELHKALKLIYKSKRCLQQLDAAKALVKCKSKDDEADYDISENGTEVYTNRVYKFGEYYGNCLIIYFAHTN